MASASNISKHLAETTWSPPFWTCNPMKYLSPFISIKANIDKTNRIMQSCLCLSNLAFQGDRGFKGEEDFWNTWCQQRWWANVFFFSKCCENLMLMTNSQCNIIRWSLDHMVYVLSGSGKIPEKSGMFWRHIQCPSLIWSTILSTILLFLIYPI